VQKGRYSKYQWQEQSGILFPAASGISPIDAIIGVSSPILKGSPPLFTVVVSGQESCMVKRVVRYKNGGKNSKFVVTFKL